MAYNIDIDVADVVVLDQNLTQSKDLFNQISKSLHIISTKTLTASRKIKPILKDVNQLNHNKTKVDRGLRLLQEASSYAGAASIHESVLNNSVDIIGLKKFINSLSQSKMLLKEMKHNIKSFKGIVINFESVIDKSDLSLQNYFQKLVLGTDYKMADICMIINYYSEDELGYILQNYCRIRSNKFCEAIAPFENINFQPNLHYEKGTNGVQEFNFQFIGAIENEIAVIQELNKNGVQLTNNFVLEIVERGFNSKYYNLIDRFRDFVNKNGLVQNDVMLLELVNCLLELEQFLRDVRLDFGKFQKFNDAYCRLLKSATSLFQDTMRFVEMRVHSVEKYTDINIPEVTVELISKIRRMSEFYDALVVLIDGHKTGDWLLIKPPVKFMSTYTSVIANTNNSVDESSPNYLLSSFFSDLIDSITINIEIALKGEVAIKKSTQGYYLLKNVILIETIVNRSQTLYDALGNTGIERMNKVKNRFLKMFLDDWNYASYIIIRDMTTITATSAQSDSLGMSNKEKEQVKGLFKNFNESFEEALRNHEKYNITDPSIRSFLASEIKKLVLNAYAKLYDRYANSEFSKNKSKYVKYDKKQFERLLNDRLG